MDKYEFNIKVEKMKKAVDRKDYVTAARIADGLNWERSTNAKVLMMIAQVYEKQERYTDARNALTEVYNRVPVGKRVVYKLTELAIKCNDLDEALDLYHEYQEIAPNDPSKLILAYKISTARGDDLEKRISILEAYRRRDFDEKWAYELATLYQQAGRSTDCVAICDELILWFGVGPYVDRAMTLKVAYAPLTPEQEEKRVHKDFYEQKLAETAANSSDRIQLKKEEEADVPDEESDQPASDGTAVSDNVENSSDEASAPSDFPVDAPSVSPVVKEAELHMTMEQELAQAIQSTSDELIPEADTNEWVTDKPISVDRVGEDIDGQYTLFRTVAEENEEASRPEHTRQFTLGELLTKTRRLENLRDLAELNNNLQPTTNDATENPAAESISAETDAVAENPVVECTPNEADVTTANPVVECTPAETDAAAEHTAVETAAVESVAADSMPAEPEITVTEEIPEENHMIFCHVLKINDDTSVVAQVRDAIRQAHQVSGIPAASVARISVEKVNRAGFNAVLKKLQGRDLLLEQAGTLKEAVISQLLGAVEEPPCTAVILLTDDAAGVAELYRKAPALFPLSAEDEEDLLTEEFDEEDIETAITADEDDDDRFEGFASFVPKEFAQQPVSEPTAVSEEETVSETAEEETEDEEPESPVPTAQSSDADSQPMTPDEFSAFIHQYALDNDSRFDSMAELALAARLDRMELSGAPMTRESAMDLVDDAIDKADRWTFKSIFVSRYDKDGYLVIKESHIS